MTYLCRHRGEAEIELEPIFNVGARRVWLAPHPGHFTTGKDLVPILQEAEWALWPVWVGFNLQTVQPVASRYANFGVLAIT